MSKEIELLERCCLTVRPKQPYLDWVNALPDMDKEEQITFEECMEEGGTAYLLPEFVDDDDRDGLIRVVASLVFESELEAWWADEDGWPEISWELFNEWFEYTCASVVLDLKPIISKRKS